MDISLLVAVGIGMLIMISIRAVAEFFKMPFKWSCPEDGCYYKMASNTMYGLNQGKDAHNERVHDGRDA